MPGLDGAALVVDHAGLEARHHLADGPAADGAGPAGDEIVERLGRAHHVGQLEAEAAFQASNTAGGSTSPEDTQRRREERS